MKRKDSLVFPDGQLKPVIIEKLADAFDINFDVSEKKINTFDEFCEQLCLPFEDGKKIYYRGERINKASRRLVPTLLRQQNELLQFSGNENLYHIGSNELFGYYRKRERFFEVYTTLYGNPSKTKMYDMMAFAQHYLDISPFIDFTKSLYVAVSFALKGRAEADDDLVLYTAFDIDDDDTTCNVDDVNRWLDNYNVNIVNVNSPEAVKKRLTGLKPIEIRPASEIAEDIKKLSDIVSGMSPTAKLIDIPTNDLMKYQQGVFLLLNDFSLIDSKYFTKAVRQSFVIEKYIISKDLCNELLRFILDKAPQYRYEYLMDISGAVKE